MCIPPLSMFHWNNSVKLKLEAFSIHFTLEHNKRVCSSYNSESQASIKYAVLQIKTMPASAYRLKEE